MMIVGGVTLASTQLNNEKKVRCIYVVHIHVAHKHRPIKVQNIYIYLYYRTTVTTAKVVHFFPATSSSFGGFFRGMPRRPPQTFKRLLHQEKIYIKRDRESERERMAKKNQWLR